MNDDQLKDLDRMLLTEMPLVEICAQLGMSFNTFRLRLAERGEVVRRVRVPVSISTLLVSDSDGSNSDREPALNGAGGR